MATLRSTKVEYFFQIQPHLYIICASLNAMPGLYPFGRISYLATMRYQDRNPGERPKPTPFRSRNIK